MNNEFLKKCKFTKFISPEDFRPQFIIKNDIFQKRYYFEDFQDFLAINGVNENGIEKHIMEKGIDISDEEISTVSKYPWFQWVDFSTVLDKNYINGEK